MRQTSKQEPSVFAVIIKSLLAAYTLTGILLLLLAFLLFKMNMKQGTVEIAILIVYIVTSFAGGFLAGKMGKNKKFIWGMAVGAAYVVVLLIVSIGVNGGFSGNIGSSLTTLAMCTGAGMLGGMIS